MSEDFKFIPQSREEQIASDTVDRMYISGKAFELFQNLRSESDMSFEDALEYIQREDGPLGKEDLAAVIKEEADDIKPEDLL